MVINPIVGVYIPIVRIPSKGGMTMTNIGSLDPGTYIYIMMKAICVQNGPQLFEKGKKNWYYNVSEKSVQSSVNLCQYQISNLGLYIPESSKGLKFGPL